MAIGLLNEQNMTSAQEPHTEAGEELDTVDIGKQLERVKWFLWHGNVVRALDTIEDIEDELDLLPQNSESRKKLLKAVREFRGYIEANQNFIPNYGDRYRHGEKISTGFAESAVNQVVSKRMVKKQQMRWTESGAQKLAAVRMLYDFLVVRQITTSKPAHAVRGPKYVVKKGKTPVWSREDAKTRLDSIPKDSVAGLRDLALIAAMFYSFARVSAVLKLKVDDY